MPRKIKNPMKHIERLKGEIRSLKKRLAGREQDFYDERNKPNPYKGECMASWREGIIDEQDSTQQALGIFYPGDMIVVTGIVKEVFKNDKGSSIKFERRQTKLVKAIE